MNYRSMSHFFWLEAVGFFSTNNIWLDPMFYILLVAAPLLMTVGVVLFPDVMPVLEFSWMALIVLIFWQPLVEELFFRGVLHGQLLKFDLFSRNWMGITLTNVLVSALFTALHLLVHDFYWALAVFVPSLIFGWFRDRYHSLYAPLVLHSFYNAVYLGFVTTHYSW